MSDYKTTLNLPSTEFPMRANLPQREPETLKRWQTQNLYELMRQSRQGLPKFILHDGPPYANGHLHCGHALNKILKDIIVKSKHLSGFDANFVPGWDCHGLPIELNVEKKIGRAGDKVSAREFREACARYAKEQMSVQAKEAERLGVVGNFKEPYATMRFDYEASVVRALGRILEQGHLQQGFKPVHWCVACASALAEAEVEYEDKTSPAIDVAFVVEAPTSLNIELETATQVVIPIWTTTPWTLPANEAVAMHPSHLYDLIRIDSVIYVIAQELVAAFCQRLGVTNYQLVKTVPGQYFEHQRLSHPWLHKSVPVIMGEHVTIDTGTGCVHTAPSHGPEDYVIGCQYGLPIENLLKPNGCFQDEVAHIGGVSVWKANPLILDLLKAEGKLLSHQDLFHSYPHCWRHKTPLIFMATPQWFVMMDTAGLRQKLLAEIEKVEWLPEWGENRMRLMIEGRPDWCLSRQRSWGTPMTLFVHKETKKCHPRSLEFIELVAQRIEQSGLEAWFSLEPKELLGDEASDYEKVTDTLDVWFDSGVSHYAVLGQSSYDLKFPADLYLEGSDQYRGWFNSSLTTAVAMGLPAPYQSVLIHGFTVDGEGKKLSKSKGNYVELETLIQQHGADILRLWVSSTDYRYEVGISPEILQRTADAYRRIRNTARFLLSNLFDYDHSKHAVPAANMLELDQYILEKTQILQQEIIKAYDAYQFHVVYQKVLHFCAIDLGSFYLDIIKDRQYTLAKNSNARRSCQTAMYHIINALCLWLAPILSFTAEEIWQYIPSQGAESIFLGQWYTDFPELKIVDFAVWEKLQFLRDEVNKALEIKRQQGVIGSGLAAAVDLYVHPQDMNWLQNYASELKFLFITSACETHEHLKAPSSDTYFAQELDIDIVVKAANGEKCERCWHRHPSVGMVESHPSLCQRCTDNIEGVNELRQII
jgi:isoleucyl-tRNA synthetase